MQQILTDELKNDRKGSEEYVMFQPKVDSNYRYCQSAT